MGILAAEVFEHPEDAARRTPGRRCVVIDHIGHVPAQSRLAQQGLELCDRFQAGAPGPEVIVDEIDGPGICPCAYAACGRASMTTICGA